MNFSPNRIAAKWSSGKESKMYQYAVTDTIPTEEFKNQLVHEIESTMAGVDEHGRDELELLLMHTEEQHPDQYPGSEIHETDEYLHDPSDWRAQANASLAKQGLRLASISKGESGWYVSVMIDGEPCKVWATDEPENDLDEGVGLCSECGGMKSEGTCECTMFESEELDEIELGWLRAAADKMKDVALTDIGGPEGFLSPTNKATTNGKPSNKFRTSNTKRTQKTKQIKNESPLRDIVLAILDEMKLSVASRGHFDFGGGEEMSPDDVASFLLSKKPESAPASGVRKKEKIKSNIKKKSKKTA
jgi:hypothetical protein